MRKSTLGAVVAAGLMAGGLSTSASAADFGGNCCADLEERIAELEATTARKGNRKVSLTISGFVAQQVVYWDDGYESNTYISDTGSISIGTHVAFTGQATIAPGWTAGYVLKIELMNNDSLFQDQNSGNGAGNAFASVFQNGGPVSVESSYWFIKSDQLGRLSVGQQSSAADNQAILPDGSGSLVQANYVLYDVNVFRIRRSDGTLTGTVWGHFANCSSLDGVGGANGDCDGVPNNNVRWDSPTFAGFSVSASWGEDDIWAVSGRYAGEFGGFKLAAAVAYSESSDDQHGNVLQQNATGGGLALIPGPICCNGAAQANGGLDVANLQIGAFIQHIGTGLFVYGAYHEEYNDVTASARNGGLTNPDGDMWYLKAGIRQRWTPLGHTVLFGYYGESNDKMLAGMYDAGVESSELTQYGLGVVQEIDAAAMSVWLTWKRYEAEATCGTAGVDNCAALGYATGQNDFEDMDMIKAGALINF